MQKDLQLETMRIYQTLVDIRQDWGGKLILCCGPECAQSGIPAAVSIAAGTSLALDSNPAAMKAAMRAGYLDFVVNTLDEALRTLKNEIRQKRPLSVGLICNVDAVLSEIVERGLQPDLWLESSETSMTGRLQLELLRKRGMSALLPPDMAKQQLQDACYLPAHNAPRLREIDAILLATLPADDLIRHRWIERVPRYLREARSGGRWICLNDQERAAVAEAGLTLTPKT